MSAVTVIAIVIALLIILVGAVGIYLYWRKMQKEKQELDEEIPINVPVTVPPNNIEAPANTPTTPVPPATVPPDDWFPTRPNNGQQTMDDLIENKEKSPKKKKCPRGFQEQDSLCWPTNVCGYDPMFEETVKECKPLAYPMSRKYTFKKKCEKAEGRRCGYYLGFYIAPDCLGEVKRGYNCYPQCKPGTRKKGNTCIKNSVPL